MPQIKLIVSLMVIVGIIIIGVAVYVVTHISGINLNQGILLIAMAGVGLVLVMGILFLVMKGVRTKK